MFIFNEILYSIDIFFNLPIKIIYLQWPIGNFALIRKDRQAPVIIGVAKIVAFGENLLKLNCQKYKDKILRKSRNFY